MRLSIMLHSPDILIPPFFLAVTDLYRVAPVEEGGGTLESPPNPALSALESFFGPTPVSDRRVSG